MTTQPAPAPEQTHTPDILAPQERAYLDRLARALRCGVPGCSCVGSPEVHCPSHSHAEAPTLTVAYDPDRGFSFACPSCHPNRILDALAKRGLAPESELYTSGGAQAAGLDPFNFLIQQPQDWLWPNRIPLGKLTLIATAVVEPGGRRFLVPLRPAMSDDAPAIPFVLPLSHDFTVAWRKPVFPAHLRALAGPGRDDGAKNRAAQAFIIRSLADGPCAAVAVEREAVLLGVSKGALRRARMVCNVICTRVSEPGVRGGPGALYWSLPQRTAADQDATE